MEPLMKLKVYPQETIESVVLFSSNSKTSLLKCCSKSNLS